MALKAKLDSLEGLDEGMSGLYTEQDGAFVLNVETVDGLGLGNTGKLEGALSKERKTVGDLNKIVKRIPEGLSIDDLLTSHTKLADLGDLSELDSLDEKLAARQTQLEEKFATDRQRLETKFADDIGAKDKAIETLTGQLHEQIVKGAATAAIASNNGVPELLLPVVMANVLVEEDDNGRMVSRIKGADGQARLSSKAGSTDFMTIEEYVSVLRDDKVYSGAFKADDAGGGGTQKPGGGGVGPHKISAEDARDPAKYRNAKAAADKAGKSLTIVD